KPAHRPRELGKEVVHRRRPQRFLRGEMVVDLRLMRADPPGDDARRGAVEPLGAELHKRGIEQALANVGADHPPGPALPQPLLHPATVAYYHLIINRKEDIVQLLPLAPEPFAAPTDRDMLPSERREFVRTHRTCVFGYARRTDGPSMSIVYYIPTDA